MGIKRVNMMAVFGCVVRMVKKAASTLKQRCSSFIPKGDERKGMKHSEYGDLLPVDNIQNGDEYITALRWAFENKKIRNIALTGPYGSGKSSIIETFLAEDERNKGRLKGLLFGDKAIRKSALKISMATFEKGNSTPEDKGKLISVNEDEVEQGILKQLFYKVEPSKIPQSRYRKLHVVRFSTVFFHVVAGLILIVFLVAIFDAPTLEKYKEAVTSFFPPYSSNPLFIAALMALLSTVGSYLYIRACFKIRKLCAKCQYGKLII